MEDAEDFDQNPEFRRSVLATHIHIDGGLLTLEEYESAMDLIPDSIIMAVEIDDTRSLDFIAEVADLYILRNRIMAGDIPKIIKLPSQKLH